MVISVKHVNFKFDKMNIFFNAVQKRAFFYSYVTYTSNISIDRNMSFYLFFINNYIVYISQ